MPQLFRPAEIAKALGCSEWWLKEQARRQRIPFTRVGGAYRFTAEHVAEIIALFEERPRDPEPSVVDNPRPRQPKHATAGLRAKPPRRVSCPSSSPTAA
nr:helix-turn-helix domain-containing protein [Streptomyces sp. UNOC14_S4]